MESLYSRCVGRHDLEILARLLRGEQNAVRPGRAAPRPDAAGSARGLSTGRSSRLKSSVWRRGRCRCPIRSEQSSPGTGGSWPSKPPRITARRFPASASSTAREIANCSTKGSRCPAIDYAEALIRREELRNELARLLHQHDDLLGCLVMPATLGPAPGLETTGDPAFNSPWSYLGWPSLTIPCGLATNGLPCGLQFIALTMPQVFAMAGLCERILRIPRPTTFAGDALMRCLMCCCARPGLPLRRVRRRTPIRSSRRRSRRRTCRSIPPEFAARLSQYQNTRAAGFAGWSPDGKGMLIRTRFGNSLQLHRVYEPGGRREQITFFERAGRWRLHSRKRPTARSCSR